MRLILNIPSHHYLQHSFKQWAGFAKARHLPFSARINKTMQHRQEGADFWLVAKRICIYTECMYEVRVEAGFSAAHFLNDYHGKCEQLHGHNYTVYAHVRGDVLDKGGMLLDFSVLKKALRSVCGTLDHRNLNDIAAFSQNPSAERIAEYIYRGIVAELPQLSCFPEESRQEPVHGEPCPAEEAPRPNAAPPHMQKPYLYAVDVFETETSRARFAVEP